MALRLAGGGGDGTASGGSGHDVRPALLVIDMQVRHTCTGYMPLIPGVPNLVQTWCSLGGFK